MDTTIVKGFSQKTCGNCGVIFWIPEELENELLRIGGSWHCPNGHVRHYTEPECVKYKRLYEETQQVLVVVENREQHAINSAKRLRDQLEKCQAKSKRKKKGAAKP